MRIKLKHEIDSTNIPFVFSMSSSPEIFGYLMKLLIDQGLTKILDEFARNFQIRVSGFSWKYFKFQHGRIIVEA